jgi:hypothetical protein
LSKWFSKEKEIPKWVIDALKKGGIEVNVKFE